jgi:hypothetical protein
VYPHPHLPPRWGLFDVYKTARNNEFAEIAEKISAKSVRNAEFAGTGPKTSIRSRRGGNTVRSYSLSNKKRNLEVFFRQVLLIFLDNLDTVHRVYRDFLMLCNVL